MKFTLVFPLNGNSSVKCAGLFCVGNRGVLRLQTGAVLELGCCRVRCATTRFWSRQCEKLFGDYAVAVPRYVCYARRFATTGARFPADSPQVQFSDQSLMPVSTPKPVEIPQVQFLVAFLPVLTLEPVEIPQVQFLDQLFMPGVGPTPVEIPQVQFLDKVYTSVFLVWCRWPDSAEIP